jgi:hypothetical protein
MAIDDIHFREQAEAKIVALSGQAAVALARAAEGGEGRALYTRIADGCMKERAAMQTRLNAGEWPAAPMSTRKSKLSAVPASVSPPPSVIAMPDSVTAIVAHPDAVACRSESGSIVHVSFGPAKVGWEEIMAPLGHLLPEPGRTTTGKDTYEYVEVDLYGYCATSQLMVVRVLCGEWDSRKRRGSQDIDYRLFDLKSGSGRYVGYAKVRGEIRTDGGNPAAGVAGALAGCKGITKNAAKKLLRRDVHVHLEKRVPKPVEATVAEQVAA